MVMCSSDLGCLIGTRVTRVTRVGQSKSALHSIHLGYVTVVLLTGKVGGARSWRPVPHVLPGVPLQSLCTWTNLHC